MYDRMIHETAQQIAAMFDKYHYCHATQSMRFQMEAEMDAIIDSIWVNGWQGKPVLKMDLYNGTIHLNPINKPGVLVLSSMPMDELVERWRGIYV